jgi:hypothetical protein
LRKPLSLCRALTNSAEYLGKEIYYGARDFLQRIVFTTAEPEGIRVVEEEM